jgi:peptidoglycan-associated lipoprotein
MARKMTLVVLAVLLVLSGGCNKAVTTTGGGATVSHAPKAAELVDEQPLMEPMPLSDDAVFEALEMEDDMKDVFVTVYFDFDRYDLRQETTERLMIIAPYLQEKTRIRLLAEGHCDEPGSSEYNIGLGEKRANAVKEYLAAYGVSANRIETTSYGKERPANPNCETPECHAGNRRVEFKVLAK